MADEVNVYGVPGLGPDGKITPFSPNAPWTNIPVVVPGFPPPPFTAQLWEPFPGVPLKFYKDVFGNVHTEGLLRRTVSAVTAGTISPAIYLPADCQPVQQRFFPGVAYPSTFPTTGTPIVVQLSITLQSYDGTLVPVISVRTSATIPIGAYIPIELMWQTS